MTPQQIEIMIYLVTAGTLSACSRVIGGIKNGCYYAKGNWRPDQLKKYMDNLHYAETPNWYCLFGSLFLCAFAIFRTTRQEYEWILFFKQFLSALLVAYGSSGSASYCYQGFINVGSNLPWLDPNENPRSEFAFGPIKFWWSRPWGGKVRKFLPYIGIISLLAGVIIGLFW